MSCTHGFDPFVDRGEGFTGHLARCRDCADVVRVLGSVKTTWKDEALRDGARAVFREHRLSMPRARRPLRARGTSLGVFVAIAITSAWAFAHMTLHWRGPLAPLEPTESVAPAVRVTRPTSSAALLLPPPPPSEPPPEPRVVASSPAPVRPSTDPSPPTAKELWELGLARLEQGDRAGAARLFERVMNVSRVDPRLRHRAMFRLAEVRLALGDSRTPGDLLWEVVRGDDATLGFDAALLLERSSPGARVEVWDAYLAANPDTPMKAQAIARRNAGGGS